mgnify:CR=1 FL=1
MNRYIRLIMFSLITVCPVLLSTSCTGKNTAQEHCISVVGKATVYVSPDQATISFSVVSQANDLSAAKQRHDTAMQKTNTLFSQYGIEQKDVTAENLTIHPRYSYNSDMPKFLYYEITQNISAVITNLDNYEPFLTDLVNSGIDRINDVRFSAKDIKKYKDEARRNAVKAAEEKAQLLCEAASSGNYKPSLGKIIRMSEILSYSDWNGNGYNAIAQNRVAYAKTAADVSASGGAPIGKISFDAQIEMVFELR